MKAFEQLTIENTTYCGANCVMCVRDKLNFKLANMKQDVFQDAVQKFQEGYLKFGGGIRVIDFGGMGEPLMDAHLGEKMEWLKEHYPNIRIDLTTNGQVLDKNLELVCKYVDVLKISNYGFSKQSFENVHRGNLVYEEVHKNILELLSIPLGKRPKVIMSFVVCSENKGEEAVWREYWEDKCEEIFVWKVHNWGGEYVSDTVLDHKNCKSCQRPGRDFTVRTNGDVTVCCWDFNRKMPIGNITEQNFEEIYYGEKLKYFLDMHKNHTFFEKDNICYNCDQLYDRSDALLYSSNHKFILGSKTNADSKVD